MDQFLPIALGGAIRSNSFGPIPPNCPCGSNSEEFVWTNSSQLLPLVQFGGILWTNSSQFLPREQFGGIRLDQFLPIAPARAIGSNSFGAIPSNCSGGSNSEQFVGTNSYQLLPRKELGAIHLDQFLPISPTMQFDAIRLDQILPIASAGAIRSDSFGPIQPNCPRGSNSEEFVWTNSSQLLPLEQFGVIHLDQFLPIAPAGAIRRNSFGAIGRNWSK